MKTFLFSLLILAAPLFAQNQAQPFTIRAGFAPKGGGGASQGFITNANATQVEYFPTQNATTTTLSNIKDFENIYFFEPAEYAAAMELFHAGKYEDAKIQFAKYKELSKFVAKLPGNYHTLSAFYELECLRKMGDLKGLAEALQSFDKDPLTREHHLRQVDLYVMWVAVGSESWENVLSLSTEREKQKMPDYQQVQVLYCKALALQKLGRAPEALTAYNLVMVADGSASRELVGKAILNVLGIHLNDEEVKTAMADWKTSREAKGSQGYKNLIEAATLAKIYDKTLPGVKPLPAEFKKLLNYQPEPEKAKK